MRTTATAVLLANKSTNVRTQLEQPALLRASFRALGTVAPTAAARWASKIFLTPPAPRPLSARAAELYAKADDRFSIPVTTMFEGADETTSVAVLVWGRGPCVYFLHGWGGRKSQWSSFVDPVVRAGFTAVMLDAPGHGESRAPRSSMLHFATALEAVVDSVGPAHGLVGHSLGAASAALALRRATIDASKAVFIAAAADPAEFFTSFLDRIGVPESIHAFVKTDTERRCGFLWTDLAVCPPARANIPPALVVHDRDDQEVPYQDAERVVRRWPNAILMGTRGLDHQRILRDAEVVRRAVAFLGDQQ
ncbi:MAG TPA: alpha/beta fold hydrolase [Polyangiaceae bacterium]|nr:alpha/beta fold hydrolase [Polyangiaceae bacterium]